ncbi:DUF418 domain-containing protein [Pseudoalteromonas pernae]|uniref:DUF418 domain-containing protein n=1 Tax=Pseudoalteromonas pernae TaxID=3118054 RepID=UPI0032424884
MNNHRLFDSDQAMEAIMPMTGRRVDLDILRGIAILGIFFLNAPFFVNFEYGYVSPTPDNWLDIALRSVQAVILDGRFRGLFIVLFTIGLVAQWSKYSGSNSPSIYLTRRLKVLLVFGIVHSFFIWAGDILLGYAIAGLIALSMLNDELEGIKRNGLLFCGLGAVLLFGIGILSDMPMLTYESHYYQQFLAAFTGDFFATRADNALNAGLMLLALLIGVLWLELGFMLLTIWAWRSGWLTRPWSKEHKSALVWVIVICALVSVWHLVEQTDFSQILAMVATSISGFVTAIVALHILTSYSFPRTLIYRAIANVGRMSLSCYLAQSIVMVTLVHYYGDVFARTFVLRDYMGLALMVMVLMVLVCNVYLHFFRQGPAEWLWRFMSLKSRI